MIISSMYMPLILQYEIFRSTTESENSVLKISSPLYDAMARQFNKHFD
jgi:hypothetical protein